MSIIDQISDSETMRLPTVDGGAIIAVYVVKNGDVGDYAVYAAAFLTDALEDSHLVWTAMHGDKLPFAVAKAHFPYLETERYRR